MSGPPGGHPIFGATTVGGATVAKECDCILELMNILGDQDGDLCFFLPFVEGTIDGVVDIQDLSSRGLHAASVRAVDNVPVIRGDLLSVRLNGTDEDIRINDNVLLTPIAGGVDVPFSVGIAFKLGAVNAAFKNLIAKWDDTTPDWEWRLSLSDLEYPSFEVVDDGVGVSNMGREYQSAVDLDTWYVLIGTYDGQIGGGEAPQDGMNLYLWNGATHNWDGAVDDADVDGGGVYAQMVDTAQIVTIGASYAGGAVSEWFPGELMMPWYTRRELSAADAEDAARLMVKIMGL